MYRTPPPISREQHDLQASVSDGNLERVVELLNKGVSPNFDHCCKGFADDNSNKGLWCKYKGETPLHVACEKCKDNEDLYFPIVKALVDHGADPNTLGFNPLEWACSPSCRAIWAESLKAVKYMFDNGADINVRDQGFWCVGKRTPLMYAIFVENVEMIELLMTYNPDLTLVHNFGQNALGYAFASSEDDGKEYSQKVAKTLLKYNFDINNIGDNECALHGACRVGDCQIITQLLDMGANPYIKNGNGHYPFSLSMLNEYLYDDDVEDANTDTNENTEGVKAKQIRDIFRARGIDVDMPDGEQGELDICKNMLSRGMSVGKTAQLIGERWNV